MKKVAVIQIFFVEENMFFFVFFFIFRFLQVKILTTHVQIYLEENDNFKIIFLAFEVSNFDEIVVHIRLECRIFEIFDSKMIGSSLVDRLG